MRTNNHGRSAHGVSGLSEDQTFELQIRSQAAATLYSTR
jgi:hypothetical protein